MKPSERFYEFAVLTKKHQSVHTTTSRRWQYDIKRKQKKTIETKNIWHETHDIYTGFVTYFSKFQTDFSRRSNRGNFWSAELSCCLRAVTGLKNKMTRNSKIQKKCRTSQSQNSHENFVFRRLNRKFFIILQISIFLLGSHPFIKLCGPEVFAFNKLKKKLY